MRSVRSSVCLLICICVRPSVCLSICLSVCPSVCLSICLSVLPSNCLSILLSIISVQLEFQIQVWELIYNNRFIINWMLHQIFIDSS